jgi:hypothetical protein
MEIKLRVWWKCKIKAVIKIRKLCAGVSFICKDQTTAPPTATADQVTVVQKFTK